MPPESPSSTRPPCSCQILCQYRACEDIGNPVEFVPALPAALVLDPYLCKWHGPAAQAALNRDGMPGLVAWLNTYQTPRRWRSAMSDSALAAALRALVHLANALVERATHGLPITAAQLRLLSNLAERGRQTLDGEGHSVTPAPAEGEG